MIEKAFLLGFRESAQGYNMEYPFEQKGINPMEDEHFVDAMKRRLAVLETEIAAIVADPNRPRIPGHYWGRWHTPSPGTDDNGEPCSGDGWEVHQVFENTLDQDDPDHLKVFVPGVAKSQPLNAFEWGKMVTR